MSELRYAIERNEIEPFVSCGVLHVRYVFLNKEEMLHDDEFRPGQAT